MNNEEEVLQASCISAAQKHFPEMATTITANYNNVGAGVEQGKATWMVGVEISKGLKSGEPDLTIYYKKRAFGVEVKTGTGTLSRNQKNYIPFLQKQDIPVFLIRDVESFLNVLETITKIKQEGIAELLEAKTPHLLNYNLKVSWIH